MITFIGYPQSQSKALYLRKVFNLKKPIRKAELDYTALGIVKAYCNSSKLGEDILTPGWTDYNVRIPYYTEDISDRLTVGKNTLSFILGNGWAVGKIAWFGNKHYVSRAMLWCRVRIEYEDGELRTFGSDDSFRMSFGQILENDLLDGEVQDARLALGDFGSAEYDDSKWLRPIMFNGYTDRLEKAISPLTLKKERFKGTYLYEKDGYRIYDFGQNHAGVPEVGISDAIAGCKLTFVYGEMLNDDGSIHVKNLRSAKATDTYICREGAQSFCPLMTFHGYRYMGVKIEGECKLSKVESRMIYTDIDFHATFECSDENINKLYSNILASQKSNFINVPTDCPQRDERLGWTGDAQVFCLSAMYNADCRAFFKKYLQDVRDTQADNGMIDSVAPTVLRDFDKVKGSPAWGDVITVMPYEYYLVYGDEEIIRENITAAKRWVDYCISDSTELIRNPRGYGDWLSFDGGTDKSLIGTAFCGYSAWLVSQMCEIIGDSEAEKYLEIYENVHRAFRNKYIVENGQLSSDSQTAYVLAYSLKMMDAEEIAPHLIRCIEAQNYHLATGFVGVKYLLPTLCDIGEYDLAYRLFTSTEHPSWCYPVVNGATTMWERWDSYVVSRGFREKGCNSFNHYAFGSVAEWMFGYVLGIRFEADGIKIKPTIDESGRITYASGSYRLDGKTIEVSWKKLDNGMTALQLKVGANVKVDLSGYSTVEKISEELYLIKK